MIPEMVVLGLVALTAGAASVMVTAFSPERAAPALVKSRRLGQLINFFLLTWLIISSAAKLAMVFSATRSTAVLAFVANVLHIVSFALERYNTYARRHASPERRRWLNEIALLILTVGWPLTDLAAFSLVMWGIWPWGHSFLP